MSLEELSQYKLKIDAIIAISMYILHPTTMMLVQSRLTYRLMMPHPPKPRMMMKLAPPTYIRGLLLPRLVILRMYFHRPLSPESPQSPALVQC